MDPQEIEEVQFKTTRIKEGYDATEVDNFLDRVAVGLLAALDRLQAANESVQRLIREKAELQRQLDSYGDLPTSQIPMQATGILEAAQRVADDVKRQAEADANAVMSGAAEDARRIIEESGKEADTKRQAAEAACWTVEGRLAELRQKHQQLRDFLAGHIKSGLEELEGNPNG